MSRDGALIVNAPDLDILLGAPVREWRGSSRFYVGAAGGTISPDLW